MTPAHRRNYLMRAPKLAWDVLVRGQYEYTFDLVRMQSQGMSIAKRVNLLKSGLNVVYRKLRPWSWPINFQIELTNYCNLKCPICPCGTNLLNRPRADFDVELYKRLMDEIGPYLLNILLWGWGEPLLHPNFPEFVRIAAQHGVNTHISTNGQNLQEEQVLEGLLRQPPKNLIVSVDGLTQESYSAYRVGADLNKTLTGVRRLSEMKRQRGQKYPLLNMRMISTKQSEHEVELAPKFAVENGFDLLSIRTMVIMDAEDCSHDEFLPQQEEYRAYRYKDGKRVRRKDFACQNAFAFPAMLLDGSVVACEQDYNGSHAYGKFDNATSFKDIWFGRQASEVRRTIRCDRDAYSTCRNCPFADMDASACTVRVYDLKSPVIRTQRVLAPWAQVESTERHATRWP